jgi:hypothetical protein
LRSYPNVRHALGVIIAGGFVFSGIMPGLAEVAGTGPAIGKKEMPNYCRNMAVEMFAVKANKVKLKKLVEDKTNFQIPGAADQGAGGSRSFHCTFDAEGRFVEMVVEAQGE